MHSTPASFRVALAEVVITADRVVHSHKQEPEVITRAFWSMKVGRTRHGVHPQMRAYPTAITRSIIYMRRRVVRVPRL